MLVRKSIREQVRDLIIERIAAGELLPGDRLVEAKLAEELSVSAIPIREAFRELVAIGILDSAPHKGAWVREVSLRETIHVLQVRSALDGLAGRLAAPRLRGRCQNLWKTIEGLVEAARARDLGTFQQHNESLHRAVIAAAENPVLQRLWEQLAMPVRTRFIMDYLAATDPVEIAEAHRPIVEALDRGDGEAAAEMLESHSRQLINYLHEAACAEESVPVLKFLSHGSESR
ncbi:MAG: GntR family transcriptional regulator [Planctomycetota bacterium]